MCMWDAVQTELLRLDSVPPWNSTGSWTSSEHKTLFHSKNRRNKGGEGRAAYPSRKSQGYISRSLRLFDVARLWCANITVNTQNIYIKPAARPAAVTACSDSKYLMLPSMQQIMFQWNKPLVYSDFVRMCMGIFFNTFFGGFGLWLGKTPLHTNGISKKSHPHQTAHCGCLLMSEPWRKVEMVHYQIWLNNNQDAVGVISVEWQLRWVNYEYNTGFNVNKMH